MTDTGTEMSGLLNGFVAVSRRLHEVHAMRSWRDLHYELRPWNSFQPRYRRVRLAA